MRVMSLLMRLGPAGLGLRLFDHARDGEGTLAWVAYLARPLAVAETSNFVRVYGVLGYLQLYW